METGVGKGNWEVVDMAGWVPGHELSLVGFRRLDSGGLNRRVLPDVRVTMVVELSGAVIELDQDGVQHSSAHFVAGLGTVPLHVRACTVDCVEIQMSPVAAFTYFGSDLASIGGQPHDIEALWGTTGGEMRERLLETSKWQERAVIVSSALMCRRASYRRVDPEVVMAWESIVRSRGTVRVNGLVRESGWSRKRLWRRFSSQIGLSPKRAARLARFEHATNRLAAGSGPAEVAAECGYFDQSHLHRDVASFARCTPSQLASELGAVDI